MQPGVGNGSASSVALSLLNAEVFEKYQRRDLERLVGAVKAQLSRPNNDDDWVAVCKTIKLFIASSNVPTDLRFALHRELNVILKRNNHGLSEMQVGCTLELAQDLAPPPVSPLTPKSGPSLLPGRFPTRSSASHPLPQPQPTKGIKGQLRGSQAASNGEASKSPSPVDSFQPPRNDIPYEMLDTYKDNSCSDRCQCIINGINRAMAKGELCCLLSGETFVSLISYNTHVYSKKMKGIQKGNSHIPTSPPNREEMQECLRVCKEFLEDMKPINTYVDHYLNILKQDYEYERSHLLRRLSYNDEWDRFRLENEGVSYFGMKLSGGGQRNDDIFVKADGSLLPYSYSIAPGQTVWVSPEDTVVVDPVDKRVTGTAEVGSIGRDSIGLRNLSGLPFSKSGLYRIDYAVTTLNLERMTHALGMIRRQYELHVVRSKKNYQDRIPVPESEIETRPGHFGIVEPGTVMSRLFFHNIRYSVATARQHYRTQFGATVPPGLPERYSGFNSYDPPPKPADDEPLTPEELNFSVQQPHPQLRAANCTPLDCTSRPLHRSQHWLNENQLAAMAKVMDEGRQVTLIQGPPGTGKTTTAIAIICEWVMWYHCRILATAHSNKGVDNLLQGLVAKGIKVLRVGRGGPSEGTDLGEYSLETLVDRHPMNARREQLQTQLKNAQRTGQPASVIRELNNQIGNYTKVNIGRQLVKEAEVVCATCIGVGSPMMHNIQFDLVLVDEATQAVEPSVLIPITRGAKQLVMIGDQAQLPPTCKCPEALMMGLDISLFDRLIGNGLECHVLDTQYRMHPTISCFPSWRFYRSILCDGITAMDRMLPPGVFPTPDSRVCFLEVEGQEEQVNTSKLNRMEANCIMWVVGQLMNLGGYGLSQIGIITPYAAQVRVITQSVRSTFGDAAMTELEVHSVDGFQGREKDFIILSMVRTKVGGDMTFITDWRRTNVALTRARYGVIVVGCAIALCQSPIWLDWLKFHINCLLMWDQTRQCVVPLRPNLLEHLQSMVLEGEVPFTMEDMMTKKMDEQAQHMPEIQQEPPTFIEVPPPDVALPVQNMYVPRRPAAPRMVARRPPMAVAPHPMPTNVFRAPGMMIPNAKRPRPFMANDAMMPPVKRLNGIGF